MGSGKVPRFKSGSVLAISLNAHGPCIYIAAFAIGESSIAITVGTIQRSELSSYQQAGASSPLARQNPFGKRLLNLHPYIRPSTLQILEELQNIHEAAYRIIK